MEEPMAIRFYVVPENEAAAIAYVQARGYSPVAIERDDNGLVVLIFEPLPDDQVLILAQAMPGHLSAKIGVLGAVPPGIKA
jgi:hypothetical protein